METWRKKQIQRQKNVFTKTSGGCVIVVRNNSHGQWIASFRAYLGTILKALELTCMGISKNNISPSFFFLIYGYNTFNHVNIWLINSLVFPVPWWKNINDRRSSRHKEITYVEYIHQFLWHLIKRREKATFLFIR